MTEKNILLIDDGNNSLSSFQSQLNDLGPDTHIATTLSGWSALSLMQRQVFDLVILDYWISDLDSMHLIEKIHLLYPSTKIILASRIKSEAIEEEARRLKVFACVTYPLDEQELLRLAQEAMAAVPSENQARPQYMTDKNYQRLCETIQELKKNVEAHCVCLSNLHGQIIARAGIENHIPLSQLASLMGGGIAALFEAGKALNEPQDSLNLIFREGVQDNIYAVNIGTSLLLILIINKESITSRLGTVWYYAKQSVDLLKRDLASIDFNENNYTLSEEISTALQEELEALLA